MRTSSPFPSRARSLLYVPLLLTRPLPRAGDDPPPPNPADVVNRFNGETVRMAGEIINLERDKGNLQRKNDNLQRDFDGIKTKVPIEGAVVLSADDAKLWAAYRENGTPDEFKVAKTEASDFKNKYTAEQTNNTKIQRNVLLRDVAGDMGYKPSVLARLDAMVPGVEYVKKPVKDGDKTTEIWFVKYRDGEGENAPVKEQELTEFAETRAEWKDFLPALRAETAETREQPARHVEQGSGGGRKDASPPVNSFLSGQRYAAPIPTSAKA